MHSIPPEPPTHPFTAQVSAAEIALAVSLQARFAADEFAILTLATTPEGERESLQVWSVAPVARLGVSGGYFVAGEEEDVLQSKM